MTICYQGVLTAADFRVGPTGWAADPPQNP
jgi:hypothetical protein